MSEQEFGQWFFAIMIAMALSWLIIVMAWDYYMRRRYRDNEEIKRRMLGEKPRRRSKP